jgi:hypothetical protein
MNLRCSLKQAAFAVLMGSAILARLYVGFYAGREWGELYVFIKRRPALTVYFVSPLGEADPPSDGMAPAQAEQEREYVEFVERPHPSRWRMRVLP